MRVATQAPSICGSHSGSMPSAPSLTSAPAENLPATHTYDLHTQSHAASLDKRSGGTQTTGGRSQRGGATTGGAIETHQRLQYSTFHAPPRKGCEGENGDNGG